MKQYEFYSFDENLDRRLITSNRFAIDGWHTVRQDYRKHYGKIETGRQLRACLRAGKYSFPGQYPLYFVTSDGAALSFESVFNNLSSVIWSIRHNANDGWRVIGMDVSYGSGDSEDPDNVYCDDTGRLIE